MNGVSLGAVVPSPVGLLGSFRTLEWEDTKDGEKDDFLEAREVSKLSKYISICINIS